MGDTRDVGSVINVFLLQCAVKQDKVSPLSIRVQGWFVPTDLLVREKCISRDLFLHVVQRERW